MIKILLKKNWSNILFFAFLALLIFPQTRMPIQVFVQRLFSFSPTETIENERKILGNYNWNLKQMNSKEINFSQSKGKVVIVNFWATWCPPCVAEMPSFQKLYNDYGDKIDFYFVTTEKVEKVGKFMEKNKYDLPIYFETSQTPQPLESNILPTTYLISKSGKIMIDEEGAADWNGKEMKSLVEKLLSE